MLFVCRANVGRSQIAEALFCRLHPMSTCVSAGTIVDRPGESLLRYARRNPRRSFVIPALAEFGIDVSGAQRTLLEPHILENVDVVVSMAEAWSEPDWLTADPRYIRWNVVDPGGVSLEAVRAAVRSIQELMERDFPAPTVGPVRPRSHDSL